MNKCIRLIWLKWQTVDLWYCREASIVASLKIQITLYGIPRFPSFDVTSMDYSEVWWLYSSPSQSLLRPPILMWDDSRLLGPFYLFIFSVSCHLLPPQVSLQLTDIVKTLDNHEFCYLLFPPSLSNTSPLGFLALFLFYYSGCSFSRSPFRLFFLISKPKHSELSFSIYTLKMISATPMASHTLICRWLRNESKEKEERGRLVQQHLYSILQ